MAVPEKELKGSDLGFIYFFRNKFSRTQIDFSRTPNFTLNPLVAKISKSTLLMVYIHFLQCIF